MSNPFDQFDETPVTAKASNPFDQFDKPAYQSGVGRTILDQTLQGAVPFAVADEITDYTGAKLAKAYGAGQKIIGGITNDQAQYQAGQDLQDANLYDEARAQSKERMGAELSQRPALSIGSNLAGALLTAAAGGTTTAGKALATNLKAGNFISKVGKGAALGAASGAGYGFGMGDTNLDSRLESAGDVAKIGGAFGFAAPAIGGTVKGIGQAVLPQIDAATAKLAQKAKDLGIPLRVDQLAPTRARRTLQKISQDLPYSGTDSFDETQAKAFNKAVAKTIGEDATDFTPEVMGRAKKRLGAVFDDAYKNREIAVDEPFKQKFAELDDIALGSIDDDSYNKGAKIIDKILKTADEFDGVIPAQKAASIRSDLGLKIKNASGDTKRYLGQIQSALDDSLFEQLPSETAVGLKTARRQYKNLKTIEDLAAKSPDGDIPATQLITKVAHSYDNLAYGGGGDLADLARIGKKFLPKAGGSDTQPRTTLFKNLLGSGAAAVGVNTVGVVPSAVGIGATIGGNRAFQKGYNQSQKVVQAILDRAGKGEKPSIADINSLPPADAVLVLDKLKEMFRINKGVAAGDIEKLRSQ